MSLLPNFLMTDLFVTNSSFFFNSGKNGLDRAMLKTMKMDLFGSTLEKAELKDAQLRNDNNAARKLSGYKDAANSKL